MNKLFDITTKKAYKLPEDLWIGGGSLMGSVDISYDELCEKIGKQNQTTDNYKVDAEWLIHLGKGRLVRIYNYKDGKNYLGKEGDKIKDIYDWHIGGTNKEDAETIIKYLSR